MTRPPRARHGAPLDSLPLCAWLDGSVRGARDNAGASPNMRMKRVFSAAAVAVAALFSISAAAAVRQEAPAAAQTPEQRFDELFERLSSARAAFYAERNTLYRSFDHDAATDAERAEFDAKVAELHAREPGAKFVPEFVALAESVKGTDVAAKSWMQVLQLGGGQPAPDSPASKAVERLFADHIQSPSLTGLAMQLQYAAQSLGRKKCVEALKKLKQDSPHEAIKAEALLALSSLLLEDESEGHDKAQAREALVELQKSFGALKVEHLGMTYAQFAERALYELDHLQLHMQVPDFEAVDQDGVKFKLSDYAGKVVVVDFWGLW